MNKTPIILSTNFCTNHYGRLKHETKLRLDAVIENVTQETWNESFCIILNVKKTLWQAVNEVDPEFAKVRKISGQPWDKLPEKSVIIRAIQQTVLTPNYN